MEEFKETLRQFTNLMELRLSENDHKTGWNEMDVYYLFSRLSRATLRLSDTLDDGEAVRIAKEAADVANFAMFIAMNTLNEYNNAFLKD